MAITQKISNFPTAPDSSTDSPTEFNTKADAFVKHQGATYVTEVNQWATEANQLEGEMNQIKTDVDNIVGAIPTGTINDSTTAPDKVWSSQKTSDELDTKEGKIIRGQSSGIEYTKLADGTLMQWGAFTSSAGANTITFAIPFTNTVYGISTQFSSGTTKAYIGSIGGNIAPASVGITVRDSTDGTATAGITCRWFAVGRWK